MKQTPPHLVDCSTRLQHERRRMSWGSIKWQVTPEALEENCILRFYFMELVLLTKQRLNIRLIGLNRSCCGWGGTDFTTSPVSWLRSSRRVTRTRIRNNNSSGRSRVCRVWSFKYLNFIGMGGVSGRHGGSCPRGCPLCPRPCPHRLPGS